MPPGVDLASLLGIPDVPGDGAAPDGPGGGLPPERNKLVFDDRISMEDQSREAGEAQHGFWESSLSWLLQELPPSMTGRLQTP